MSSFPAGSTIILRPIIKSNMSLNLIVDPAEKIISNTRHYVYLDRFISSRVIILVIGNVTLNLIGYWSIKRPIPIFILLEQEPILIYFNLEAVQDGEVMQDFESESFVMGGDHSQKVKAPPITNDYGSKDCVNLPSSTAVSGIILSN